MRETGREGHYTVSH